MIIATESLVKNDNKIFPIRMSSEECTMETFIHEDGAIILKEGRITIYMGIPGSTRFSLLMETIRMSEDIIRREKCKGE